jgi:hypothetical protein
MVTGPRPLAPPRTAAPSLAGVLAGAVWLGPPLLAGAAAFLLARSAMLPGVGFWDTAEFQTVAPLLGTAHAPGFPTYVIFGWIASALLTPVGEPALRMNLFAGLSLAVAAALSTVLLRRLTGWSAIGVAAGIGLAATPLAWRIGTRAEPHALHLTLLASLLVLLVGWELARRAGRPRADRWLIAAAAVFGLSAGNHSLTLLLAPAIGVYVLAVQPSIVRRPRLIATCAAALVGTLALVYLELPVRAGLLPAPLVYGRPDTWDGFWYIALAQQFQGSVGDPLADLPRKSGELAQLAERELGVLALLLPAAGLVTMRRFPRFALLTGLAMLTTVIFAASYANADIARYYLGPLLMAWTWLGILAATTADALLTLAGLPVRRRAADDDPATADQSTAADPSIATDAVGAAQPGGAAEQGRTTGQTGGLTTPAAWNRAGPAHRSDAASHTVALALAIVLALPAAAALPDNHRIVDLSGDRAAAIWLDTALSRFADNAVVISWWSYSTALWYAQKVEGRRPDIFIVDDRTRLDLGLGEATDVVARYLGQRPVYVIRANQRDLGLVLARYELRPGAGPASNVYEVVGPVRGGA